MYQSLLKGYHNKNKLEEYNTESGLGVERPNHRKRRRMAAKKVWKLLCRLIDFSGINFKFPKTYT
jgi:hypothetical protein